MPNATVREAATGLPKETNSPRYSRCIGRCPGCARLASRRDCLCAGRARSLVCADHRLACAFGRLSDKGGGGRPH